LKQKTILFYFLLNLLITFLKTSPWRKSQIVLDRQYCIGENLYDGRGTAVPRPWLHVKVCMPVTHEAQQSARWRMRDNAGREANAAKGCGRAGTLGFTGLPLRAILRPETDYALNRTLDPERSVALAVRARNWPPGV
jgi:hypothetical protein